MTDQEFKTAVLKRLDSIDGRLDKVEDRLDTMTVDIKILTESLDKVEDRLAVVESFSASFLRELKKLSHTT